MSVAVPHSSLVTEACLLVLHFSTASLLFASRPHPARGPRTARSQRSTGGARSKDCFSSVNNTAVNQMHSDTQTFYLHSYTETKVTVTSFMVYCSSDGLRVKLQSPSLLCGCRALTGSALPSVPPRFSFSTFCLWVCLGVLLEYQVPHITKK